jgi:hypothetical protein
MPRIRWQWVTDPDGKRDYIPTLPLAFGEEGWKAGQRLERAAELRERIAGLIELAPGCYTAQLCRYLNGGRISPLWCGRCRGYANLRKHRSFILHRPCAIRFPLVQYYLRTLLIAGRIVRRMEQRPDHYQNRRYDLMSCYYPAGTALPAPRPLTAFRLPFVLSMEVPA